MSEHKVSEGRPTDPFDRLLSDMLGLPNGASSGPSVVQAIDFYGNATSFMVQSVRTEEQVAVFITVVNAQGSQRFVLPRNVLDMIDRQRASLTYQVRRRHGRRVAEERKAAGHLPGFMKGKRRKGGKG